MKLLLLCFNFPPDLSPGSFRMKALIAALEAWRAEGLEIDVITTRPNRYATFAAAAPEREDHGWLRVTRIDLPAHKSGMADQSRAFAAFARRARAATAGGRWDAVFTTSSRLMTAALGAHLARRARAPLYLDIRDLFTDTMSDLLAGSPLRALMPAFRVLEKRTFRAAARINLVSPGFLPHMRAIAPGHDYRLFSNGVDDDFLAADFTAPPRPAGEPPLVLYAGNMGEGQGLHTILPPTAAQLEGKARFRLLGDGGRRRQLEAALAEAGASNVKLRPPVPRGELLEEYHKADILFLHLNDHRAFLKVLPSKIFEYGATGKPILAGVAGYAADFLRAELPDAEVFRPCDVAGMVDGFERLAAAPGGRDRRAFREKYARGAIMARMAEDVMALLRGEGRSSAAQLEGR